MPSNTLLISLSTGETLYLPPRSLRSSPPSRAPSPNAGYNSDPETEVHRIRPTGDIGLQSPKIGSSLDSMPTSPTISELDGTHRKRRTVKSGSWQDLLKYVIVDALPESRPDRDTDSSTSKPSSWTRSNHSAKWSARSTRLSYTTKP